jgi:glc operon protein GlcG
MRSSLASLLLALALPAAAQPAAPARDLGASDAKLVIAAAAAEARRLGAPGAAIAVVDAGGHLVALERLDGTFPAASAVSIEKARTAAVFRRPTQDFENAINGGRPALLGNWVMLPLQGGVPLERGSRVVGAIGVSGAANAQQDNEIAKVAVGALP